MQTLRRALQERNIELDAPLLRVLPELEGLVIDVEPLKNPATNFRRLTLSTLIRLRELMHKAETVMQVIYGAEDALVKRHTAYRKFCAERLNLVGRCKITMESGIGTLQKAGHLLEDQRKNHCMEHLVFASSIQYNMRATRTKPTPSAVRKILHQLHYHQHLIFKAHQQQVLTIRKALKSYAQIPAGLALGIQMQAATCNLSQTTSKPAPGFRLRKTLTLRNQRRIVPLASLGGCAAIVLHESNNHQRAFLSALKRLLTDLRQRRSQSSQMTFRIMKSKFPARKLALVRTENAALRRAIAIIADLTGLVAATVETSAAARARLIHNRDVFTRHSSASAQLSKVALLAKAVRELRLRMTTHEMTPYHEHHEMSAILCTLILKAAQKKLYLERIVGKYSTMASSCISTGRDVMAVEEVTFFQKDLLLQDRLLETENLLRASAQIYAAQHQAIINRKPKQEFADAPHRPLISKLDIASHITSARSILDEKMHSVFKITDLFNQLIDFQKVVVIWSNLKKIQIQRSERQVAPICIKRLIERPRRGVVRLSQKLHEIISKDSVKREQPSSRLAKAQKLAILSSCLQQLQLSSAHMPSVLPSICNHSDALHRILREKKSNPDNSKIELATLADRCKDLQAELVDVESELLQVYAILRLKLKQDLHAGRFTEDSKRELYTLMQREIETLQRIQTSPKLSDLSTLSDSDSSYRPLVEREDNFRVYRNTEKLRRKSKDPKCYIH